MRKQNRSHLCRSVVQLRCNYTSAALTACLVLCSTYLGFCGNEVRTGDSGTVSGVRQLICERLLSPVAASQRLRLPAWALHGARPPPAPAPKHGMLHSNCSYARICCIAYSLEASSGSSGTQFIDCWLSRCQSGGPVLQRRRQPQQFGDVAAAGGPDAGHGGG